MRIGVDGDHVKSKRHACEALIPRQKHRGSAHDFRLFTTIDRQLGWHKRAMATKSYLDNYQTRLVSHDQVELTETASEVPMDGNQAALFEISKSKILSIVA